MSEKQLVELEGGYTVPAWMYEDVVDSMAFRGETGLDTREKYDKPGMGAWVARAIYALTGHPDAYAAGYGWRKTEAFVKFQQGRREAKA